MKHVPVLLDAVLETLGDIRGKDILDATFGAGGYSTAFLEAGATVVAFDRDPNVVNDADYLIKKYKDRFSFVQKPFSYISGLEQQFDAIVFDLGISSMQIDNAERGFSFRMDASLDMRMSGSGISAAQLIKDSSVQDIANILKEYGDIKKAIPIAKSMKEKLPETTFQLKELIFNPKDVAPVFQALRIAVNDEMGELKKALNMVPSLLRPEGICICVTFHSLEDRIVKNTFKNWATPAGDPRLPTIKEAEFKMLNTYTPDEKELKDNTRARSAHLRAVKKSY